MCKIRKDHSRSRTPSRVGSDLIVAASGALKRSVSFFRLRVAMGSHPRVPLDWSINCYVTVLSTTGCCSCCRGTNPANVGARCVAGAAAAAAAAAAASRARIGTHPANKCERVSCWAILLSMRSIAKKAAAPLDDESTQPQQRWPPPFALLELFSLFPKRKPGLSRLEHMIKHSEPREKATLKHSAPTSPLPAP